MPLSLGVIKTRGGLEGVVIKTRGGGGDNDGS